ncbi:phosphatidylserine decarboxylase family protein [Thermodesulfobacteriota bacterium]
MSDYFRPEKQRPVAFPIARAGYPFIYASAFTTGVFALLGLTVPALLGLLVTLFVCYFFRDPDRIVPRMDGTVVSPADGKIIFVETIEDDRFYKGTCIKISIFMSVFNVHINRIPHEGEIKKIEYFPGKFFAANLDKASKDNEHNAIFIETEAGRKLCMVQIAGLIARRIICTVQTGDNVIRGQRFGLICFGSRVDIYLPEDSDLSVSVGDRVTAGASILGCLK